MQLANQASQLSLALAANSQLSVIVRFLPSVSPFFPNMVTSVSKKQDGDVQNPNTRLQNSSPQTNGWCHGCYVHYLYCLWVKHKRYESTLPRILRTNVTVIQPMNQCSTKTHQPWYSFTKNCNVLVTKPHVMPVYLMKLCWKFSKEQLQYCYVMFPDGWQMFLMQACCLHRSHVFSTSFSTLWLIWPTSAHI